MGISGQVEGLFPSDKKYSTTFENFPKSCIRFFFPEVDISLPDPVRAMPIPLFPGGPYRFVQGCSRCFPGKENPSRLVFPYCHRKKQNSGGNNNADIWN